MSASTMSEKKGRRALVATHLVATWLKSPHPSCIKSLTWANQAHLGVPFRQCPLIKPEHNRPATVPKMLDPECVRKLYILQRRRETSFNSPIFASVLVCPHRAGEAKRQWIQSKESHKWNHHTYFPKLEAVIPVQVL